MKWYIGPGIFLVLILAFSGFMVYFYSPAIRADTCLGYRITNAELVVGQVIDSEYVKKTCYVQIREGAQWYKHGTYSRSTDWNLVHWITSPHDF